MEVKNLSRSVEFKPKPAPAAEITLMAAEEVQRTARKLCKAAKKSVRLS
jgi:hypothetical protein